MVASRCQTLISSGASSVASLTLTGATSSITIDGRLDTTLTSGMCCREEKRWMKRLCLKIKPEAVACCVSTPQALLKKPVKPQWELAYSSRFYIYMIKIFLCVLGTTHGFGCEVEVGESIQLEEECVHKLLNFHMRWVLLLLSLLLNWQETPVNATSVKGRVCGRNSENKVEVRPGSAFGIPVRRFLSDSACSSHGPASVSSCTQTPPPWVSLCAPRHRMPGTQSLLLKTEKNNFFSFRLCKTRDTGTNLVLNSLLDDVFKLQGGFLCDSRCWKQEDRTWFPFYFKLGKESCAHHSTDGFYVRLLKMQRRSHAPVLEVWSNSTSSSNMLFSGRAWAVTSPDSCQGFCPRAAFSNSSIFFDICKKKLKMKIISAKIST